jgi:hypothetical protein
MIGVSDLPFLLACLVGAALVSGSAFFIARLLTSKPVVWRTVGGLTAPLLIAFFGLDIEKWDPDPHGWALPALLLLALISLPVSLLVSGLLAKRFTGGKA